MKTVNMNTDSACFGRPGSGDDTAARPMEEQQ